MWQYAGSVTNMLKIGCHLPSNQNGTLYPYSTRAGFILQDIGITEGEKHVQIQSTDGVLVVDSKGLSRHHE